MSKHPEAQGDGAGRAMGPEAELLTAESLGEGRSRDARSREGRSHEGHSHEGHSHEGHSHEGHSQDGHSQDGHSHEGHSHRLHGHVDEGAPAHRSQAARAGDAPHSNRVPCIVIVDEDVELCAGLSLTIGASCRTHCVAPAGAVALLQSLLAVDVALVDCDPPPSVQAPIFGELARWPAAICVLMSANAQKVEQFRALGVFAPLVLDKPVHAEALEAIRSATLELCRALG